MGSPSTRGTHPHTSPAAPSTSALTWQLPIGQSDRSLTGPANYRPPACLEADSGRRSDAVRRPECRISPLSASRHEIGRAHSELQSLMRISYAVFCLQTKHREVYTVKENNR